MDNATINTYNVLNERSQVKTDLLKGENMRRRNISENMSAKRLLGITELTDYLGVGHCTAAEFGKKCGAVVRIGRRVLYDRAIIDEAIEKEHCNACQ